MMQLAIFINKDIEFFLENCQLCRKSGNDATSRGRWGGGGGGGLFFASLWCNAYENRYVIHTSPQKTLIVITTVTC